MPILSYHPPEAGPSQPHPHLPRSQWPDGQGTQSSMGKGCWALTLHSIRDAAFRAAALPRGPLLPQRSVQAAIAVFAMGWVTVWLPIFQRLGSFGLWTSRVVDMQTICEPGSWTN